MAQVFNAGEPFWEGLLLGKIEKVGVGRLLGLARFLGGLC